MQHLMLSKCTINRRVKTNTDGIPSFSYTSVATNVPCRVDLFHRPDPGDALVVWEAGTIPDRNGTVFFLPSDQDKVQVGDTIEITSGPYADVVLSIEVRPTPAYGMFGMNHVESMVREVSQDAGLGNQ